MGAFKGAGRWVAVSFVPSGLFLLCGEFQQLYSVLDFWCLALFALCAGNVGLWDGMGWDTWAWKANVDGLFAWSFSYSLLPCLILLAWICVFFVGFLLYCSICVSDRST